jgi:hypothetical protein
LLIFAIGWRGLGLLAAVRQATAPVGSWELNPDRGPQHATVGRAGSGGTCGAGEPPFSESGTGRH